MLGFEDLGLVFEVSHAKGGGMDASAPDFTHSVISGPRDPPNRVLCEAVLPLMAQSEAERSFLQVPRMMSTANVDMHLFLCRDSGRWLASAFGAARWQP